MIDSARTSAYSSAMQGRDRFVLKPMERAAIGVMVVMALTYVGMLLKNNH